jgi:splicing factor 3A subunit 3
VRHPHHFIVTILTLYSTRQTEIGLLNAPPQGGGDLDEFYKRLKKIQDHHARYPNQVINGFEMELDSMIEDVDELDNEEYEQDDRTSFPNTLFTG